MSDNTVIKEYKHYVVQVGTIIGADNTRSELGYLVVNKATNVTELERSVLPEALNHAGKLDMLLEEILNGPAPEIAVATQIPPPKNLKN